MRDTGFISYIWLWWLLFTANSTAIIHDHTLVSPNQLQRSYSCSSTHRPSPCRRRWQAVNPQIPNAKQALSSKTSRDRAKQSANPNRVITYLLLLLQRLLLRLRLTPRRRSLISLTRRRLLVPLLVLLRLLLGWRAILCIRWRRSRRVVPVLHPKQKKINRQLADLDDTINCMHMYDRVVCGGERKELKRYIIIIHTCTCIPMQERRKWKESSCSGPVVSGDFKFVCAKFF